MYDLIVLGGGPAGYLACERAGHEGLKTLLIEKREVGGVCLNEGCIPTKTLLYSAKVADGAAHGDKYGVIAKDVSIDHQKVISRKEKVIAALVGGVKMQLKGAKIEVKKGEGKILGKKGDTFEVGVGSEVYAAKKLLITTGSVPVLPPIPGLSEGISSGFCVTSREMLELKSVPKKLVVIGGGVIGLEMASYYRSCGSDVAIIEMLPQIGGMIDADIAKILQKNYEKKGIKFLLNCKVVEFTKNSVKYTCSEGTKEEGADVVLVSIGRKPYIEGIGLEAIGVATERGAILTDDTMKTNIPNVYAAGDVNGKSMLAHTAYREAEVAINNMVGKKDLMSYAAIPGVIYTNPEVAGVGETEQSAKAKGIDCVVKNITMNFSGRYLAENPGGDGIIKIIVDKKYDTLIGCHVIANYASEFIIAATAMIAKKMKVEEIKKIVFPHPTVSEIIREAIFQL